MKRKAQLGAKSSICDPRILWIYIYGTFILGCWTPYYCRHAGCHAYIPVPVSRVVHTDRGRQPLFSPRAFGALGPAQIEQILMSNTRKIESHLGANLADLEDGFDIGNGTISDTQHEYSDVRAAAFANVTTDLIDEVLSSETISSRRNFFAQSSITAIALVGIAQTAHAQRSISSSNSNSGSAYLSKAIQDLPVGSQIGIPTSKNTALMQQYTEPIDIQKIIKENTVNVTIRLENDENTQLYVNRTSFEELKIQEKRKPGTWTPIFRFYHPKPEVVRKFNDKELFFASILAGSVTEVLRSTILYPIATVKTRVQVSRFSSAKESSLEVHTNASPLDCDESTQISNVTASNPPPANVPVPVPVTDWYLTIGNSIRTLINSIVTQTRAGNLYAGYLVSLITTVPAAGAFYGVREVTKRGIIQIQSMDISQSSSLISALPIIHQWNDLSVTLAAALVADIVSLAVRTPAVVFSVRRQAATMATQAQTLNDFDTDEKITIIDGKDVNQTSEEFELAMESVVLSQGVREEYKCVSNDDIFNSKEDIIRGTQHNGDGWVDIWNDFCRQFPTVVLTDLPYLALKITLLRTFATGHESIPEYQILNILVACVAALITTPFDVARTVILVDSDRDPTNGLDGGTGGGIFEAMLQIMSEGLKGNNEYDLRVQNLFSGWLERVVYFGVAVALLDPLRILGYIGIRDRVLLLDIFQ